MVDAAIQDLGSALVSDDTDFESSRPIDQPLASAHSEFV
jgi:hypothetical protein